jgi:tetratricopeptide (TPR) repeat protein
MATVGIEPSIVKDIIRWNEDRKLKGKYVLVELSNDTVKCGKVSYPEHFSHEALSLEDIESEREQHLLWNHIRLLQIYNNREDAKKAIEAFNESKKLRQFEIDVISPLSSAEAYYNRCREIHTENSDVSVLTTGPGLLLSSHWTDSDFTRNYFETILRRLESGRAAYSLRYLFDLEEYKKEISDYVLSNKDELVEASRTLFFRIIDVKNRHRNLDIRYSNPYPLGGAVIGGTSKACLAFTRTRGGVVSEGVFIKHPALLKILVNQYDNIFQQAKELSPNFFSETLSSIKSTST